MKPTYAQLNKEHSDLKYRFDVVHAERGFYWEKIQDYKHRTGIDILSADNSENSSEHEKYRGDGWGCLIEAWLQKQADEGNKVERLTTTDILENAIGIRDPSLHHRPAQMRVIHAMTQIGWVSKRAFWDGEGKPESSRWVRGGSAQGLA